MSDQNATSSAEPSTISSIGDSGTSVTSDSPSSSDSPITATDSDIDAGTTSSSFTIIPSSAVAETSDAEETASASQGTAAPDTVLPTSSTYSSASASAVPPNSSSSQVRFTYTTRSSSAGSASSAGAPIAPSTVSSEDSSAPQSNSAEASPVSETQDSKDSSRSSSLQAVSTAYTTFESTYTTDEESVVTSSSGSTVVVSTTTRKDVTKTTLVASPIFTQSGANQPGGIVNPDSGNSLPASADDTNIHSGVNGGAKAGIGIGILAAVVAVIVALHYITRHVRHKRSAIFLSRARTSLKPFPVRRDDFTWKDLDRSGGASALSGEKKEEQPFSEKFRPPSFREVISNPITALSPTRKNRDSETPMWMRQIGLNRPPKSAATDALSSGAQLRNVKDAQDAQEAVRVSITAPSEVSSAGFLSPNQHARTISQDSGNHLHPLFIPNSQISPTFSQHSIASLTEPSPSSSLENLARSFPMPQAMSRTNPDQARLPPSSGSPVKPFASNNPFRNSVGASSMHSGNYRHSLTTPSVDDSGNPFELDFDSSEPNLELDFRHSKPSLQLKKDRVMSGFSYYNPTTPVTPHNPGRRPSHASSVYSNNDIANPWPPLEAKSPARSRAISQTSETSTVRERARSISWADDLQITHREPNPRTYSTILDAYSGHAM